MNSVYVLGEQVQQHMEWTLRGVLSGLEGYMAQLYFSRNHGDIHLYVSQHLIGKGKVSSIKFYSSLTLKTERQDLGIEVEDERG